MRAHEFLRCFLKQHCLAEYIYYARSGSKLTSISYLRNRKHFSCFCKVIVPRGEVCKKREIAWEHVRTRSAQFRVSRKLPQVYL